MNLPTDYYERVYAGILGKIIGVYLGRPIEGWTYAQIMSQIGEVRYYVNERRDLPLRNHLLVVTDDDISGTFTFLRALPDYDYTPNLSPAQIGQTWLNYIIENRTILWWGGLGNSTEHTAFLRLKDGIPAPQSGSMALNSRIVAEQIGAQIFIEGWGLVSPGDPAQAAALARRAASVSHDGEAIYAAQVIATLVAGAFIEPKIEHLLTLALAQIPADSVIAQLIADLRAWHAADPLDWHAARARLEAQYGYEKFGGNCHVVPNHGLVILGLLYSNGDFSLGQTIVNTCGWDTDCNAANLGCILGVRNGLAAFETGPDWRGPLADRLYLSAADGGRAISDALREADFVVETAYRLAGMACKKPKGGARFHFSLPGAIQGFCASPNLILENLPHPHQPGRRVLGLKYRLSAGQTARALTPVFIPPEAIDMPGYALLASPALYPGQTIRASLVADEKNRDNVQVGLQIERYGQTDETVAVEGSQRIVAPGAVEQLDWQIPALGGQPIAQVGIFIHAPRDAEGTIYLDWLDWDGAPKAAFHRPEAPGRMWKRQWVNAADFFEDEFGETFRVIQNRGRGLVITGTREWSDYRAQASITPHMADGFGLAVRVQGLERYYALLLSGRNTVQLVKRLDGEIVLAEAPLTWDFGQPYELHVQVQENLIQAWVNKKLLFVIEDDSNPLTGGGIGLVCESGRIGADLVTVGGIRFD
jgi:ADP-ribosylglycohydrolase